MKTHASFKNNSADAVELRWEVTEMNVPEEWQAQLCDNNNCYAFGQYSNIDASVGLDVPVVLEAGESSLLDLGVRHKGVAGCGTYQVKVTTTADTSTVLASATYELKANVDANCEALVSNKNLEISKLKVFPNPTYDYFTITDNTLVREIQIFNIVGKRMANIAFQNGNAINVMSLPNGLYLVRMLDSDQNILKTTRLTKR
jgi:hypothetical protein